MNELNYITAAVLRLLAENPSRVMTVLEYACVATLLIAVFTDSFLRNRRLARQQTPVKDVSKIGRQ